MLGLVILLSTYNIALGYGLCAMFNRWKFTELADELRRWRPVRDSVSGRFLSCNS